MVATATCIKYKTVIFYRTQASKPVVPVIKYFSTYTVVDVCACMNLGM